MKNRRGFTLIELLAIIVILAIIAVITVPIVLNIIENAKRGAAQDSALGYSDAVRKYYVANLTRNPDFELANHDYIIGEEGRLVYNDTENSSNNITYEIALSGNVPSNGFVRVYDNKVTDACLTFNEYSVLIVDGKSLVPSKGQCNSIDEIGDGIDPELAINTEYLFPYVSDNDKEQTFDVEKSGYYKLEVWGAQGGSSRGGYGGYASGVVHLTRGTTLYINVGGQGGNNSGGYNGGGDGQYYAGGTTPPAGFGGGGATHIALKSGVLSSLNGDVDKILIVAGAGVGASESNDFGGHGGGSVGGKGIGKYAGSGGTQFVGGSTNTNANTGTAGLFGQGGNASNGTTNSGTYASGGGGGGFYGGGGSGYKSRDGEDGDSSGAGGSSYIGNSNLLDGIMYCYGCAGAMSISTTGSFKDSNNCPNGYSGDALSNCAKSGNGYAKITYVGKNYTSTDLAVNTYFDFDYILGESRDQVMNVPTEGYYKLEVWGAQGGNTNGGYGGYSSGIVHFNKGDNLYINVGGRGGNNDGGWNGGGSGQYWAGGTTPPVGYGGGGATHMALTGGALASLSSDINSILIVAGGGGGASESNDVGGHGGGYVGVSGTGSYAGTGGVQDAGGITGSNCSDCTVASFGQGGNASNGTTNSGTWASGGGGGGYYGGGASGYQTGNSTNGDSSGAGGSGYIGNSKINLGVMYCYNCTENGSDSVKTVSTTGSNRDSVNCPNNYSSSALTNCAKAGNGYARVTYIGKSLN